MDLHDKDELKINQAQNLIHQNDEKQPFTGLTQRPESVILKDEDNQIFWLEFVAIFVFIFGSTCFKPNTGLDLQFFVSILMAIPICARQSGAHLNPAVSLSSYLNYDAKMPLSILWIYFKAQTWGAIASIVIALILNDVYRSPLAPIQFTSNYYMQLMGSQAIGTFILVVFVLWICSEHNYIDNTAAKYFYVATFVYIGRKFATFSASQINVSLTISRALIGIPYCDFSGIHFIFIWIIGDFVGVILAIIIFGGLAKPTLQYLKSKKAKTNEKIPQKRHESLNQREDSQGNEVQMNDMKH